MSIWHLVIKEIRLRRLSFGMGLIALTVAVAVLAGSLTILEAHEIRTEEVIAEKELKTRAEMAKMEDDYRKMMKAMGYNVLILSSHQDLADLRSKGYADAFMPEDYATRLGKSGIQTLNHLLPILQQVVVWPEIGVKVMLSGIKGQVPVTHRVQDLTEDGQGYIDPIMFGVPAGKVDIGYDLAINLSLKEGSRIKLMGQEFTINRIYPHRGNLDDIAVWCDLAKVQKWLGREGQINGIFALECSCRPDQMGLIAKEVHRTLPDTQVLEFTNLINARAQARRRAKDAHEAAVKAELEYRDALRSERAELFSFLVPISLVGSAIWVFFLIMGNVRERKSEIGILRAIGFHESTVLKLFLIKALSMGVLGGFFGYIAGWAIGTFLGEVSVFPYNILRLFDIRLLGIGVVTALVISAIASYVPAAIASRQDPAEVLREV